MTSSQASVSPFGWYIASYALRFVELGASEIEDADAEFLAWENTILVEAGSLDEAFEKAVAFAQRETEPYQGGEDGVVVQWLFEGITNLLPIYEPLGDGAEIMWEEREGVKLRELRNRAQQLSEIKARLDAGPRT